MKKISYFLSYAYSIQEGVNNGTINRLEKELAYLSRFFVLDVYSKDSSKYLEVFAKSLALENVKFYGINFSNVLFRDLKWLPSVMRRIMSIVMLVQYYLLTFKIKKNLDKSSVCFISHVSGGMRAVLYKKFFNPKMKVIVRYNWNWGDFIKERHNNLEYKFFSLLERFILNNADVILATTEKLKEQAYNIVKGKRKVDIVPNWIDCNKFRPIDIKKEFDIISVGRLCRQKNHRLLLEAVDSYNKTNGEISLKLLIISKGELKETLIDYARKNNIDLTIIDRAPNNEMPEYLNRAKLFIMSSKYEGHPKAMLEAMACGIPVIGTDVVGINDILKDGENGLICKQDAVDLASKIESLLNNYDYEQELGNAGMRYVKNSCSLEIVANKIIEYLGKN